MTSDAEAAAEVLAGFVPIDNGDSRVQEFEAAVRADMLARGRAALRPSPTPEPTQADRIESKLDRILDILGGGEP